MAPRKAAGKKGAETQQVKGAPKLVTDAYAAYRRAQDEPSLEALIDLVQAGTGRSAGCLALCKASLLHAALVAGETAEGRDDEVARFMQQATEAAIHGALRYKSLQLLDAAARLLYCTYTSPHRSKQRTAAYRLLIDGLDEGIPYGEHGAQCVCDQRVLPVAALEADPAVPRRQFLRLDEQHWWDELGMEQWVHPSQEWVGTDRWPWEFKGGARESDLMPYFLEVMQHASDMRNLQMKDSLGGINDMLQEHSNKGVAGSIKERKLLREMEATRKKFDEQRVQESLAERMANNSLLPPDRALRLRDKLKLRTDVEHELTRTQQPSEGGRRKQDAEERQRLLAQRQQAKRVGEEAKQLAEAKERADRKSVV